MKIAVHIPLGGVTGYGRDGEGVIDSLIEAGHDVHVFPKAVVPPISPNTALALTKMPVPPFDVSLVHVWPGGFEANAGRRSTSHRLIGWTMWEHPAPDPEWAEEFAEATAEMDLLLVYDETTETSLGPIAKCPVKRLQGGYDPSSYHPEQREWTGTFRFGMMGDLANRRKDPFTAIRAFTILKERHGEDFDAVLHLKSSSPGIPPRMTETYPWLQIDVGLWPVPRVQQFYAGLHCLIAPSRGEGKNLPALEAMTTGIPVIASLVGGHKEWFHPSMGWGVPAPEVPFEGRTWARVDPEALAEAMWEAYSDRALTRRKGEQAQRTVPAMCSWTAVTRRFMEHAQQIPAKEATGTW